MPKSMKIPLWLFKQLSDKNLMLTRNTDGSWMVFYALTQGFATGADPISAYGNFVSGNFAIMPETGKIAKIDADAKTSLGILDLGDLRVNE